MFSRKKVLLVLFCLLAIGGAYWVSTYYLAYTDDAYVNSDVIRIAPEVSGTIAQVAVTDNQKVGKGDLLFALDPASFEIELRVNQARLNKEKLILQTHQEGVQLAAGLLETAKAKLALAQEMVHLNRNAVKEHLISQAKYQKLLGELSVAKGEVDSAAAAQEVAKRQVNEQEAAVRVCQAEVDLSQYRLERTKLFAPSAGHVASLRIRQGDYAAKGKAVIALVASDSWRVEANYREQFLRHMKPGQKVWLYLDGHPWRIYEGRIQGIRKGVSREPTPSELLPYVKPTTNWIRLSRRFPVRIALKDVPPDLRLRMGADARTLVFY